MAGITEQAVCCEACGYCAHEGCVGAAVFNCKPVSLHIPAPVRDEKKASTPSNSSNNSNNSNTSTGASSNESKEVLMPATTISTIASDTAVDVRRALGSEIDDGFAFAHQWVPGNHSTVGDECIVCSLSVGSLFALSGRHCVWCQSKIHDGCMDRVTTADQICRLGLHRRLIVPPTGVRPIIPDGGYTEDELQRIAGIDISYALI